MGMKAKTDLHSISAHCRTCLEEQLLSLGQIGRGALERHGMN
jgi:hypothetical protein